MPSPTSTDQDLQKNSFFTILVLDSNFATDVALADFLKREGYAVIVAGSTAEALAQTRRFEPDLILLDCELKGLNCMSLLPELLMEHPGAAVILLANRPSVSNVVEAIHLGAVDFFERPLDLKGLKLTIDHQMRLFKPEAAPG